MNRLVQWKSKPLKFENQVATRQVRADRHQARRQNKREEQLNRLRCVPHAEDDEETFEDSPEERAIRLEKWKKERDLKKKLEAKKQRPAFVIGVPHHNFYSPTSREPPQPHCHRKPKGLSPPKRLTVVTQRRIATRAAASKLASASMDSLKSSTNDIQVSGKTYKIDTPPQPRLTRSRKKMMNATDHHGKKQTEEQVKKQAEEKSDNERKDQLLVPQNYEFKGPIGIAPIPLFGNVFIPDMNDDTFSFNLNGHSMNKKTDQQLKIVNEQNKQTPLKTEKSTPRSRSIEKTIQPNSEAIIKPKITPVNIPKELSKKILPNKIIMESSDIGLARQESNKNNSSVESEILRAADQSERPPENDKKTNHEKEYMMNLIMDSTPPPKTFSPVPAQFSPFIVTSRGKSSARKEQKQRLSLHKGTSPNYDIPTKDTIMQTLNISAEEEETTSQYYKHLLQTEQERLTSLCDTWKPIQEDEETPEDGVYMINQAIGQTNLLICKKFSRFSSLVLSCETGKGEQLVRCADLQGFWEMMEMEIRDCNSRFTKLDQLKSNGWKEEEKVEVKILKKKTINKKKKIEGKSTMRAFIETIRKQKKVATTQETAKEIQKQLNDETKQCVVTPRRSLSRPVSPHSRAKLTPCTERTSLLKMVQLTESAKRITQNSFAMVKVSHKAKTPEVRLDRSISYINSDQTPGKGILKKTDEDALKSEQRLGKLTHKVNFNDTVEMAALSVDELPKAEQNKRCLTDGLASIGSLDYTDNDEDGRVNKKLEFGDEDDDDDNDNKAFELARNERVNQVNDSPIRKLSSTVEVTSAMPSEPIQSDIVSKPCKTRRSLRVEEDLIYPTIVLTAPTPVSEAVTRRSSHLATFHKPIESPVKPRKSSRKSRIKDITTESIETIKLTPPEECRKKKMSNEFIMPALATPEDVFPKVIPIAEAIPSRKGASSSNDKRVAARKTPKKQGKKNIVDIEQQEQDDSGDGSASTSKSSLGLSTNSHTEAVGIFRSPPKRQLRNREILADNVTLRKHRNSTNRKSEQSVIQMDMTNYSNNKKKEQLGEKENHNFHIPNVCITVDSPSVRRSTRKSIRFLPEDDCTACQPIPLTPRSLKARISFFGDSDRISQPLANGDLMAFDSPKTPRARLRRSSTK